MYEHITINESDRSIWSVTVSYQTKRRLRHHYLVSKTGGNTWFWEGHNKKKSLTFNHGLNQCAVQLSSQLEWRGLCPQSGNYVERAVSVRKPRTISRPGLDKDSSWQYHLPLVPCNLCVISVYVCCHGNYTVSKVTCACVPFVIG